MEQTITKKDIAQLLSEKFDLKKKDAQNYVNFIFDTMSDALCQSKNVDISGFGKFVLGERAERQGMNPATKEKITIPAKTTLKFKASRTLKNNL